MVLLAFSAPAFSMEPWKSPSEDCGKYLLPPLPREASRAEFYMIKDGLIRIQARTFEPRHPMFSLFEAALRRRSPALAENLLTRLRNQSELSPSEYQTLLHSVFGEFREIAHSRLQISKVTLGQSFRRFGAKHLHSGKLTPQDQVWIKLGFRSEDGQTILAPTHLELAQNLKKAQKELNVPKELRLGLTAVHMEAFAPKVRFHALDEPLPPGSDVPTGLRYLSNSEFFDALDQNLMLIEATTHDIAHVVAWTLYPELFDDVRKLGRIHLANPSDQALELRTSWFSEYLVLPDPERVRLGLPEMISRKIWERPDVTVQSRFHQVQHEVNQIPFEELKTYAERIFAPRYRSFFEPFGGGMAQYGEMESSLNPYRLLDHYYKDRTPITSWTHESTGKTFRYFAPDLAQEQASNLGDELRAVLKHTLLSETEREAQVRDIIARMELSLGELS